MKRHTPNCLFIGLGKPVFDVQPRLRLAHAPVITYKSIHIIRYASTQPQRKQSSTPRKAPVTPPAIANPTAITQPPPKSLAPSSSSPSTSPSIDDPINPPSSTLPAPVNAPEREEGQSKLKWLFKVGKAYWAFYKTGLRNIFANRRLAREVRRQASALGSGSGTGKTSSSSSSQDVVSTERPAGQPRKRQPYRTRAEFQLLLRSSHDLRRIPLFAVFLLVFGEYLPLIVIFLTPLVPYTCRIPRQVEKAQRKAEERRSTSFRGGFMDQGERGPTVVETGDGRGLSDLKPSQLRHISRSLGLHWRGWDSLPGAIYPPSSLLRFKVNTYAKYLTTDDTLLLRAAQEMKKTTKTTTTTTTTSSDDVQAAAAANQAVDALSLEEVKWACKERGLDLLGVPEGKLRGQLKAWLATRAEAGELMGDDDPSIGSRSGSTLGRLLLSRSNAWKDS